MDNISVEKRNVYKQNSFWDGVPNGLWQSGQMCPVRRGDNLKYSRLYLFFCYDIKKYYTFALVNSKLSLLYK
jgi:hypothetical protein